MPETFAFLVLLLAAGAAIAGMKPITTIRELLAEKEDPYARHLERHAAAGHEPWESIR